MARPSRSPDPSCSPPRGRFHIEDIDGWLGEFWVADGLNEDSYIEILPDGSGTFDLGEVQGSFGAPRGLRAKWVGENFDETLEGTITFPPEIASGLFLATITLRGEEPWLVQASAPGRPSLNASLLRQDRPGVGAQVPDV